MNKPRRVVIATLSGLLFGFVCFGFASAGPAELPWPVAFQIIISRTLIGFAIGIGWVSFGHWTVRGLLYGLLFSLPLAFSGLMAPDTPETAQLSRSAMFAWTVILGMMYGLLIEVITTVIFKARLERSPTPAA